MPRGKHSDVQMRYGMRCKPRNLYGSIPDGAVNVLIQLIIILLSKFLITVLSKLLIKLLIDSAHQTPD
jgi:hypothetical protein